MKARLAAVAAAVGLALVPSSALAQEAMQATSADDVMISLVHGIPGMPADVMIGDSVVINAFQPGSIADITAFRGRTLDEVSIVDDATGDVVVGPITDLDVPATGSWSLVAHLQEDGTPTISTFENERTEVPAGSARLTFRHTAAAPAVDLVVGDQRPITNAVNGDSASIELPDGTLSDAQVAPTGEPAMVSLAAINLAPDTDTVIYAIGSIADDELDFVVQVLDLPGSAPTTTDADSAAVTTTTDPSATTTTESTTTTVESTTTSTTTTLVPTEVATGAPLDGTDTALILASLGGLVVAGGAMAARRRI